MKKLAWYTAAGLATIALVALIWEFQTAIILFVLSLMVTAILSPLVNLLIARGLARGFALLISYFMMITLLVGLVLFLGGPIVAELQAAVTDFPDSYALFKIQ